MRIGSITLLGVPLLVMGACAQPPKVDVEAERASLLAADKAWSQMVSDMDKVTQNQLARGARMVELLKQGQYQPLQVERQVLVLFAGLNGFLDALPIDAIGRWERELYPWLESRRPDVFSTIRAKANDGKAFNELTELMKSALGEYNKEFQVEQKKAN